ncbi:MAG: lysozyme [Azoarcus sp.]|jgi:lysozyme|nr:lysozyme [Azoarcus sp.]
MDLAMRIARLTVASLALTAAGLVGILNWEGWSPKAVPPVKGDVPTYGFGTTTDPAGRPLKGGETIAPPQAVKLALRDVQAFEGAIKRCVTVPLHQHEYDAYVSLAYNIGGTAFCGSTLVKRLNAGDYPGACAQILRWNRFKGKVMAGLKNRREAEYRMCMGGQ